MEPIFFSAIESNSQKLDGGAMFGNAPRAMWEKWIAPDEQGRIPLSCRCMLVEYQGKKILFETGIGAFFDPKLADRFGVQNSDRHMLQENLKKLSIEPSDIDCVVLSHLHFDHAGGLLPTYSEIQSGHEGLLFSNAQFLVGEEAWERAIHPHFRDRASFIDGLTEKLQKSGRLQLVKEGDTFFDSHLRFFSSQGHTPGQLHAIFQGNHSEIVFCADLIPGRHWVHLPITMGYDRYPEKLIEEKMQLYKAQDLSKTWFFFTHDNECAAAKIEYKDGKRYQCTEELNDPVKQEF